MKARLNKLVMIFAVFALIAQSLAPVMAVTEMTMQCAGMPVTAMPCARAIVPSEGVTDRSAARLLACCCIKQMAAKCGMTPPAAQNHVSCSKHHAMAMPPQPNASTVAGMPGCTIKITPGHTASDFRTVAQRRWLLMTAPAQAPPAAIPFTVPTLTAFVPPFTANTVPPCPDPTLAAHGLRAPPVS